MGLRSRRTLAAELPKKVGEFVELFGWVQNVRVTARFVFVVIRDRSGVAQVTVRRTGSHGLEDVAKALRREDVVRVKGLVVRSKIAKLGYEVLPEEIEVLNRSKHPLPLDTSGHVDMELNVCLDSRAICLRRPEYQAVFKIASTALRAMRDFFTSNGYLEVITSRIIACASEGGADLFEVNYFDRKVFLAQSPQLYKEMLAGAFEKVFEIGLFYRAEKSRTTYHLAEFVSVDIEEAFASMDDVMDTLEGLIKHVVKTVGEENWRELETLEHTLPQVEYRFPRLTYTEALEMLRKEGYGLEWGDDFGAEEMRTLGRLMSGKFYFIVDWPLASKPFYTMPSPENPRVARAFDLNYEWLELASGGERIYKPEVFLEGLRRAGLNPEDFRPFIHVLEHGMPPHAGFGLGFSRLMMVLTGMKNIRQVTLFPRDVDRVTP